MSDNQHIKKKQRAEINKFKLDFYKEHGIDLYIISSLQGDHVCSLEKYKTLTLECISDSYPKLNKYNFETKSRERDFVQYIQAMSFLAFNDGYSKTAIGIAINRNHATVINSCKIVSDAIETQNPEFIKVLNKLQKKIDNYVGTISKDFKGKNDSKSMSDSIWDEARRIINS